MMQFGFYIQILRFLIHPFPPSGLAEHILGCFVYQYWQTKIDATHHRDNEQDKILPWHKKKKEHIIQTTYKAA
jgi:hypothetical protein